MESRPQQVLRKICTQRYVLPMYWQWTPRYALHVAIDSNRPPNPVLQRKKLATDWALWGYVYLTTQRPPALRVMLLPYKKVQYCWSMDSPCFVQARVSPVDSTDMVRARVGSGEERYIV